MGKVVSIKIIILFVDVVKEIVQNLETPTANARIFNRKNLYFSKNKMADTCKQIFMSSRRQS